MKKMILAIAFTVFTMLVPVLMAQAFAQDGAQLSVEQPAQASNDELVTKEIDSNRSIVVAANNDDESGSQDRIARVVDGLGEVFGEQFSKELRVEIGGLNDDEKAQLNEALGKLFEGDSFSFDAGGLGVGEAFVAITALCLTLGLPVIILLLVLIFGQRKRKQMMDLAGMYVKADRPMPEHVMAEFGTGLSGNQRLRTGLQYFFVGLALVIILGAISTHGETATIGFLPMAVGISRLIYWKYEQKRAPENDLGEL